MFKKATDNFFSRELRKDNKVGSTLFQFFLAFLATSINHLVFKLGFLYCRALFSTEASNNKNRKKDAGHDKF